MPATIPAVSRVVKAVLTYCCISAYSILGSSSARYFTKLVLIPRFTILKENRYTISRLSAPYCTEPILRVMYGVEKKVNNITIACPRKLENVFIASRLPVGFFLSLSPSMGFSQPRAFICCLQLTLHRQFAEEIEF